MPKTTVNLVGSGAVSVGWSKTVDGTAQIGVGRYGDPVVVAPSAPLEFVFADFSSRNEINSLIRTLRKARDDAFGRDE